MGPGILFAGAAIGVSHLVQSTRAGAGWGFGLWWAVVLAMVCKYPAIEAGHRYTVATGESLLHGYLRLGRWALGLFMAVVVGSAFITMAAVTAVTAGLCGALLGLDWSLPALSALVLAVTLVICAVGRYHVLDLVMKVMVVILGLLTVLAVAVAAAHGPAGHQADPSPAVWSAAGITFLLALMGWMPTPLDVAVWPSLWILEKSRRDRRLPTMQEAMVDFHLGYVVTGVLALAFLSLGALVMHGTGRALPESGVAFGRQLVDMYAEALGPWSRWVISVVAFITMFSTTLTVLDGYARAMAGGVGLLVGAGEEARRRAALVLMPVTAALALVVIAFFLKNMRTLVDVATVLAFLAAPLLAWLNMRVVRGPAVPTEHRPGAKLTVLTWVGLVFLLGFGLVWVWSRWLR
ncbi:MAG TPA: divalent metal cation transporter [Candidatus Krumholzibacteria bacterium]|nr:divalent metal cation transporter [Candidatus Krumholzibacteria bacterium]